MIIIQCLKDAVIFLCLERSIFSVLGHIMDCMLPSQIAMGKFKKDKSEEDQIKTATNKAVQWTKTVLSRRYNYRLL